MPKWWVFQLFRLSLYHLCAQTASGTQILAIMCSQSRIFPETVLSYSHGSHPTFFQVLWSSGLCFRSSHILLICIIIPACLLTTQAISRYWFNFFINFSYPTYNIVIHLLLPVFSHMNVSAVQYKNCLIPCPKWILPANNGFSKISSNKWINEWRRDIIWLYFSFSLLVKLPVLAQNQYSI